MRRSIIATTTATPWLARYTASEGTARVSWSQDVQDVNLVPWNPSGALALSSRWSVATDWKMLLAIEDGGRAGGDSLSIHYDALLSRQRGREAIRGLLAKHPPAAAFRCPVAWLSLWCEQVTWTGCEDCGGDGDELGAGCDSCLSTGRILPAGARRPGLVAGALVSRNVLAWALAPELLDRGGDVAVGVVTLPQPMNSLHPDNHIRLLHVRGEGWWLVLMGLNATYAPPGPHPTFHADDTYLGLWATRHDPEGRLILADWLQERDDPYAAVLREGETL